MRFQPAAYGLALVAVVMALPLQIPILVHHRAWARGSERTLGHVDKVINGYRMSVEQVGYSPLCVLLGLELAAALKKRSAKPGTD